MKKIAPSILSADFSKLALEVAEVERGGADWIHVDVMDGHFVPNLTIGPLIVKALKPHTKLPLDCHLMVTDPETWLEPFQKAGAASITVHIETVTEPERVLKKIRGMGLKSGISLNPATEVSEIEGILPYVDLVLVMSVQPGFGGQKFMPNSIPKIEKLHALRKSDPGKYTYLIEVDGGVGEDNIGALSMAGADVFVAGNSIFGAKDRGEAILRLRAKLK